MDRSRPFQRTFAPGIKLAPVTVSSNAPPPAVTVVGWTLEITGMPALRPSWMMATSLQRILIVPVRRSVLSPGILVHSQALIESSVLLGGSLDGGVVNETSIGRHCRIRNAIIDDGVSLREGTTIGYDRSQDEARGLKVQPLAGGADYLVTVPHGFST